MKSGVILTTATKGLPARGERAKMSQGPHDYVRALGGYIYIYIYIYMESQGFDFIYIYIWNPED